MSYVSVLDPYGRDVVGRIVRQHNKFLMDFTPREVGPHTVELLYGDQPVQGSPFTSNIYDASRVRIHDVTDPALPSQPAGFTGKVQHKHYFGLIFKFVVCYFLANRIPC